MVKLCNDSPPKWKNSTNIPMNMSVNMYIVGYVTGNFNWKSCFTTNPAVVQLWVQ